VSDGAEPASDMASGPISPSGQNGVLKGVLRDSLSPRPERTKSSGITLSPLAVQMISIKVTSPTKAARPASYSDSKSAPKLQATGEKPPAYKDRKQTDMSRSFFRSHGKAWSNQGSLDRSQSDGIKNLTNEIGAQRDDVTKLKEEEMVIRKVSGFSVESADAQTPSSSQADSRRASNNLIFDSDGYSSESGGSSEDAEDNEDNETLPLNLQASMSQKSGRATRTANKATSVHEMVQNTPGSTQFLAKLSSMDLDMSTRRFQDVEFKDRLVRAKTDAQDTGYESEPSAVILGGSFVHSPGMRYSTNSRRNSQNMISPVFKRMDPCDFHELHAESSEHRELRLEEAAEKRRALQAERAASRDQKKKGKGTLKERAECAKQAQRTRAMSHTSSMLSFAQFASGKSLSARKIQEVRAVLTKGSSGRKPQYESDSD